MIIAPACHFQHADVAIVQRAPALYPKDARERRNAAVVVHVTVGPSGNAIAANTIQSSGDPALDRAAADAALQTKYSPKIIDCRPTTGDYVIGIVLDPAIVTPPPYPQSCLYGLPSTPTPQPTAYLTKEQILERWRLEPGDALLTMARESYADYLRRYRNAGCSQKALLQVWVVRIKFTQPHQFKSVEYASGIETLVLDAATGDWLEIGATGNMISGPFHLRP